jgi:ribosomal protein S18 acetylase RimI-like enzyme
MFGLEIRPFSDEHLDAAARLLAERHASHRQAEPLLPKVDDFRAQVERDWRADNASGAVAVAGSDVAGYLIGRVTDIDCLVDFAGYAARDPELIRDLYAHVAAAWVDEGHVRHRVHVPASDADAVDAWFRLAFGLQLTFGVRETAAEPFTSIDVIVRRAREDDLDASVALARHLHEHQLLAPSFSGRELPSEDEYRESWRDTWQDPDFEYFVAERDGRVVGHLALYRGPPNDLRVAPDSIDLSHAVTIGEAQASGVGVALTTHALTWAHEAGYRSMTVDWREVNLLSSRFWPRRGFRPTFYRLYRHVP